MSETEDRLFGMMAVIDQQQVAMQAALEGLAAERDALQRVREAFARDVRELEGRTRVAVRTAVSDSLAEAATDGVRAVGAVMQPLLNELAGVGRGAALAEAAMRGVVRWASWRLLGWIAAAVGVLVLAGWLASTAVLWRDDRAVDAALARRIAVQEEIALLQDEIPRLQGQLTELRANYDGWAKAGALAKVTQLSTGTEVSLIVGVGNSLVWRRFDFGDQPVW